MQSALFMLGLRTKAVHILALIMKTKTCFITLPAWQLAHKIPYGKSNSRVVKGKSAQSLQK